MTNTFWNSFSCSTKGRVESIILHRNDAGLNDSWFVEHVSVEHSDDGEVHFPLVRRIPANQPMQFLKFDSYLPHDGSVHTEELYEQRTKEIATKQQSFAFTELTNAKGMPRSVREFI